LDFEIAAVLIILAGTVLLFIAEWVRMDVVALLVLVSLALTGLVTPAGDFINDP
jgi:di/tricarboxylate transporter